MVLSVAVPLRGGVNTDPPISFMDAGMVIEVREVAPNASSPMYSISESAAKVIDVIFPAWTNAPAAIPTIAYSVPSWVTDAGIS
nr:MULTISPECIES: hypothetical protein [unclassified Pseudoflavonifractor]